MQYIGYSGGRGLVNQDTKWAQAGYAQFIMDTRGQGYGGTLGETADPHPSAGEVAHAGLMTRGVGSREDYYYRRVYVDAFRAVEAAQSHPEVDPSRAFLAGVSQGGGVVVAVAGLVAGRLRDRYEHMLAVLNYFDGVNMARSATAPALYSAAQMDDICPPSTVFASYNAYGSGTPDSSGTGAAKDIEVYRFNHHEGGQEHHWIRQLMFMRKILG